MKKTSEILRTDSLMFCVSLIWGSTFVLQKIAMSHIEPFYFTAIRFALGALVVLPFATKKLLHISPLALFHSFIAGFLMFVGISLQQVGLVYTTAIKASFITSMYVCIVPCLQIFFRKKISPAYIFTSLLAALGLYLLIIKEEFSLTLGDSLIVLNAFAWAFHILWIAKISPKMNVFLLSFLQFFFCALLSFIVAIPVETFHWNSVHSIVFELIFTGIISVGFAFSLQVYTQKKALASHAALIFSLEGVIGALFGWIVLNEILTSKQIIGCIIIFLAITLSQQIQIHRNR